jgi:hypothetical protein
MYNKVYTSDHATRIHDGTPQAPGGVHPVITEYNLPTALLCPKPKITESVAVAVVADGADTL